MPVPDIAPSFPLLMSLSVRMTCFSYVFPPHKQVSINSTWWFYMLLEFRCKDHGILPIIMQFIRLIGDCHSPPPCRIQCIRSPQFVPQMDSEQFSVWGLSWPMQPWTVFHMPWCVWGDMHSYWYTVGSGLGGTRFSVCIPETAIARSRYFQSLAYFVSVTSPRWLFPSSSFRMHHISLWILTFLCWLVLAMHNGVLHGNVLNLDPSLPWVSFS